MAGLDRAWDAVDAAGFGMTADRLADYARAADAAMVLDQWKTQAREALDRAAARYPAAHGTGDIFIGRTWDDAMHAAGWMDADVLVVGSSATSPIKQVFLGSSATKIVRHSPVPVVVVP